MHIDIIRGIYIALYSYFFEEDFTKQTIYYFEKKLLKISREGKKLLIFTSYLSSFL